MTGLDLERGAHRNSASASGERVLLVRKPC
jgi:hypothetical protein